MAVMTRGRAAPATAAKPAAKAAAKPKPKAKAADKPPPKKPPMPTPKVNPTAVDGILSSPIAGPKLGGADLGGGFTPPAPARGAALPMPARKPMPPTVRGGRPF